MTAKQNRLACKPGASSKDWGSLILSSPSTSHQHPWFYHSDQLDSSQRGDPAKSPTCWVSRTIDVTWVTRGSASYRPPKETSFSCFPRCWVFAMWDHLDVIVEWVESQREYWTVSLESFLPGNASVWLSPVTDWCFQSHLGQKRNIRHRLPHLMT